MEKIFNKKPHQAQHGSNCTKIRIYQKDIIKRLGIDTGPRKHQKTEIPEWVLKDKRYLKRYLRGLYEAEGSFCVHEPTCTYKFIFNNRNESLLGNVFRALKVLGFHPHRSKYKIQISRKKEVYECKELLQFREY